jgi:hypothetical protein
VPTINVDYRFTGLPHNKKIFKLLVKILQSPFQKIKVEPGESSEARVYRQIVGEIEKDGPDSFSKLKTAFCERHGVALQ